MPPAFIGGFVTALTGGAIAFGAPTAAFAAGVAAAGFATSTVGSIIITGALIVGSRLLSRGQTATSTQGLNEARGSIRQPTPAQRVIYGESRVGGALFYHNDTQPPYLVWGLVMSARPVTRIKKTLVGVNEVAFGADLGVLTPPYLDGADVRLWASFRDGDPDQAIDPIIADFDTSLDPATFRQRGHATAVFKAAFGNDSDDFDRMWGLGTQIPNILMDVEGAPVHDPRVPASDYDDPTTWRYSNNAALVQADWLRQPYGGRVDPSRMRWDEIADAANYDDELVGIPSGFQKRYTIDGVIDLSQDPAVVAESLMAANRGFVATDQGRLWVTSSRPQTPVLTITDAMLRGGFVYQETKRKDALLNTVRSRFVAPDREYAIIDGPVRADPALVTADGQTLDETVGLNFTLSHERAQRLAELAMRQSRLQKAITTQLPLRRSLGLRAGQVVRVQSDIAPRMDGLYQVEAIGFSDDYTARPVTLTQYDGTLAGQFLPADYLPFEAIKEAA